MNFENGISKHTLFLIVITTQQAKALKYNLEEEVERAKMRSEFFVKRLQFLYDINYKDAIPYFEKSANSRVRCATGFAAFCYSAMGDNQNSFLWYKKGAELGDADSQFNSQIEEENTDDLIVSLILAYFIIMV